ncbi:2'-5' RNA ligase family protein [Couchioplanes caeruleus]|uniref:2'-5' RNA ligase family protein n=1 Tax=Couchioplanes caeruleus TaxID=56438 RepID=UPI0020BE89DA|nr:2'-5' RNA ligase family protein [Couchioplanes caeruleus]UQU65747.1 2'-5' RNA ligase family protein [Couchioplanes caeruleus]
MHTVELLLDAPLSSRVREVWHDLAAAGLRSLASHQHPTNRPHVTLAAADALSPGVVPALAALPLDVELADVVFLGRTVAWRVRPSAALLSMQRSVWEALDGRERNPLHEPGRWVPHVSLALRVKPELQARYPRSVGAAAGRAVAARTYNSETRTVTGLA